MLTIVAVFLVIMAFADIVSGIFITRFVERLRTVLFEAVEEQRQAFRQMKQAGSELKSAELRREVAQHKCDELHEKLSLVLVRLNALADHADQRKDISVRGQRPG